MATAKSLLIAVIAAGLVACGSSNGQRVTIGSSTDSDGSLVPLGVDPTFPPTSGPESETTSVSSPPTRISTPGTPVTDPRLPRPPSGAGTGEGTVPAPVEDTATTTETTVPTTSATTVVGADPPVATTTARREQSVRFTSIPSGWRFPDRATILMSASSGLDDFEVSTAPGSACAVEEEDPLVLRSVKAGMCTITVVQPGDTTWMPAGATTSIRVSQGTPAFSDHDDVSVEWRASVFPFPLATTSTAGPVLFSTSSPACDIGSAGLEVDLVSGLPRTCEILATSPATDDYVEASTTYTVDVLAIRLGVALGAPVHAASGIAATIVATTEIPSDLGALIPVFGASVTGPCTIIEVARTASTITYEVAYNIVVPLPGSCDVAMAVDPAELFVVDGAVSIRIDFA